MKIFGECKLPEGTTQIKMQNGLIRLLKKEKVEYVEVVSGFDVSGGRTHVVKESNL